MDTIKIPLKIFTTYEALQEYYGDRNDLELGMYEDGDTLVVGHSPNAYSFNPQYFTGENQYVPNYVPDSPFDPVPPTPAPTPEPSTVADPVITIVKREISSGNDRLCVNVTCETENATIMFGPDGEQYENYAEVIAQMQEQEGTIEIDGKTYLVMPESVTELTIYAYAELGGNTSNTVSETYAIYVFNARTNGFGLISVNGGEPVRRFSAEFVPGENTYELEVIPNSGYEFESWKDENTDEIVSTDNPYTVTPTKYTNIYAAIRSAATTANISISANDPTYGSVDAAGSTIIGESYTVMAEANTGYMFVNWTENGNEVSTSANYTFTVTGDRTLVANFDVATTTPAPAGGVADPVLTYFLSPVDGENYSKLCVNATCETVGATTYLTVSSNGTDMGPYDFELWKQMGTVEKDGVVYVKTVNLGTGEDMSTTATISSYAQLNEDTSSTVTTTATFETA